MTLVTTTGGLVTIRVRVESDELPDEQPEVVVDYMVRGRRPQPA